MLNKILIFGTLFALLVSCQNVSSPSPLANEENSEVSLFSDSDLDNAILMPQQDPEVVELTELVEVEDGEQLPDLADVEVESELSGQAILPNVDGHAYYIEHDPNLQFPYSVFRHDQSNNVRTRIYQGAYEVQSVAGNYAGNIFFISVRDSQSDKFEIYRLQYHEPSDDGSVTVTLPYKVTDNSFDNINVSTNHRGTRVAYQLNVVGNDNTNDSDVVIPNTIVHYFSTPTSHTSSITKAFPNYRDPSIQFMGNGDEDLPRYLVAVRDLNNGRDRIVKINIGESTVQTVATSRRLLENPSIDSAGDRVMWSQHNPTRKYVRVKTLSAGTTQNVYSNSVAIEHPFITVDGNYMIYGRKRTGGINVYTKDLVSGTNRRLAKASSPVNYRGMVWSNY